MDFTQTTNMNTDAVDSIFNSQYMNVGDFLDKAFKYIINFFDPSYHVPYLGNGIKLAFAFLSIFFIFIITYTFIRMLEIRKKEHEYLHHEVHEYAQKHKIEEMKKWERGGGEFFNKRWNVVLEYLFSENSGDWKLAVIEADGMLDALLDQLGFKGENLGEKLKSANQESFRSLSYAWEVHIIRNKIAHEGSDFELSQREAKRVIALYEQIFREFGYI